MLKNANDLMAMVKKDLDIDQSLAEPVKQEFQKTLTLLKDATMKGSFKSPRDNMQALKKLALDSQLGDPAKYRDFTVLTTDQAISIAHQQN